MLCYFCCEQARCFFLVFQQFTYGGEANLLIFPYKVIRNYFMGWILSGE